MKLQDKKVAIVHDWVIGGGAEKVLEQLHVIFPDAPIYTGYCSKDWQRRLDGKVVTGYLQHWPFSKLRKFLPVLRARWFRKLPLEGYDLVISSTGNGEAKQITKPKGSLHICFCHTPPHYLWRHRKQYLKTPGFGLLNPLVRGAVSLLVKPLRKRDFDAAQKVDFFIANSSHIKKDIKIYYGRESVVIFPPVDIFRFAQKENKKRSGFVTIGRQTGYKKTDIIIQACNQLRIPLTVVGRGPENKLLRKIAGPTIKFDSNASDKKVTEYLKSAEGFIFAAEEDFGITPVEAMASGTPVIAYHAGGAIDYVKPGLTGDFFDSQSTESLIRCLKNFEPHKYNEDKIRQFAKNFSEENFRTNFKETIKKI